MLIDLSGVTHHPAIEEVVDVLCMRTNNQDRGFYRTETAYFLCRVAAAMRAAINVTGRGEIPINAYCLNLATSGYGKGWSVSILEDEIFNGFSRRFRDDTFPMLADQRLWDLANEQAARSGEDQQKCFDALSRNFASIGKFVEAFDSGSSPAVKQYRTKLLMAKAGAINFQVDEIGLNLTAVEEILNLYLELYDKGMVKQKLTKQTADNQRLEELDGHTPCNMLLFGTPAMLLDGGAVEDKFYSMLETGYARRCFFGWGDADIKLTTPEQMLQTLKNPTIDKDIKKWNRHFYDLADPTHYNWRVQLSDEVMLQFLTYEVACKTEAAKLPEHDAIRKAEMSHRHSKALKLAGALAFIDSSSNIEMEHLMPAILMTEESGEAFGKILMREANYIKLARFVGSAGTELTHHDLQAALPFYPKSGSQRNDMLTMAIAWGYRNHTVVKKSFRDGIEILQGESLKETSLDEMILSYSDHLAFNYEAATVPFNELHQLTQAPDFHWANHAFRNQHRTEDNAIPGFNLLVLDVDGGTPLAVVQDLMQDYTYLIHTTKNHQQEKDGGPAVDRFRVILPLNYHLKLNAEEYREFMDNVTRWLPWQDGLDTSTHQRSRKWRTCEVGEYFYNEGQLIDALPFIPKTQRNDEFQKTQKQLVSLGNLERWFAQRIATGSRNNQMLKYAMALADSGMPLEEVKERVLHFNGSLDNGLTEQELEKTIFVSLGKKFALAA